ncbi:MAG: hypothetical protein ABJQ71_21275 [Roseibium sp.]
MDRIAMAEVRLKAASVEGAHLVRQLYTVAFSVFAIPVRSSGNVR